jgi:hypothetical protein
MDTRLSWSLTPAASAYLRMHVGHEYSEWNDGAERSTMPTALRKAAVDTVAAPAHHPAV